MRKSTHASRISIFLKYAEFEKLIEYLKVDCGQEIRKLITITKQLNLSFLELSKLEKAFVATQSV